MCPRTSTGGSSLRSTRARKKPTGNICTASARSPRSAATSRTSNLGRSLRGPRGYRNWPSDQVRCKLAGKLKRMIRRVGRRDRGEEAASEQKNAMPILQKEIDGFLDFLAKERRASPATVRAYRADL